VDLVTNSNLTEEQQQQVKDLLLKYWRLFAPKERNFSQNSKVQHYIETGIHQFIQKKLRITDFYEEKVIKTEVDEMLKEGIIWKSKFTWAAPILLIDKPNKGVKFCVNYRKLNEITKKNVCFLPKIDDILDRLARKILYYN
jgi:hypothetical protein